ncbi:hypothetical protein CPAR01_09894 [Colletotrichum paranaense]|uniref:Uncharacterized protein n=1 Tax=Colletotrichum paranaense TaxID=1914294 RepID=A0ABQ9SCF4_9PEZI|nr:uncharacterized protein CPAR01_09894 [Colletotrichum paranaense]KAK1533186.1 hypothetical protein CPAR01_09894 [Colletotrichum paranaense]
MATSQVPTALGLPQSPPASSTPWPLPGPLPVLPSLPCFLGRVGSSSLCFSGHCSPKSSNCIRCVHMWPGKAARDLPMRLVLVRSLARWRACIGHSNSARQYRAGLSWPVLAPSWPPYRNFHRHVKTVAVVSRWRQSSTRTISYPGARHRLGQRPKAHRAPVVLAYGISSTAICRPPGAKAKAHSSSVSKSCRISDDDFLALLTPFGGSGLTNQVNHTFNSLKTSSRFDIINTGPEAFYNDIKDTT